MSEGPDKKSLDQLSQRIAIAKKAGKKTLRGNIMKPKFSQLGGW